jgi:hypothetical protein
MEWNGMEWNETEILYLVAHVKPSFDLLRFVKSIDWDRLFFYY